MFSAVQAPAEPGFRDISQFSGNPLNDLDKLSGTTQQGTHFVSIGLSVAGDNVRVSL